MMNKVAIIGAAVGTTLLIAAGAFTVGRSGYRATPAGLPLANQPPAALPLANQPPAALPLANQPPAALLSQPPSPEVDNSFRANFMISGKESCVTSAKASFAGRATNETIETRIATYCTCTMTQMNASFTDDELLDMSLSNNSAPLSDRVQAIVKMCVRKLTP